MISTLYSTDLPLRFINILSCIIQNTSCINFRLGLCQFEQKWATKGAGVAHPRLDQTQSFFESLVFCRLVVIVGLYVECWDFIHHLQRRDKQELLYLCLYRSLKHTKGNSLCFRSYLTRLSPDIYWFIWDNGLIWLCCSPPSTAL